MQVQVKTGESPPAPPGEPPAPTTATAPGGPIDPTTLRAQFPHLSDDEFAALTQQGKQEFGDLLKRAMSEMPPLPTEPAAKTSWLQRLGQTMARLGATTAASGPWTPVAEAPVAQPEAETPARDERLAARVNAGLMPKNIARQRLISGQWLIGH